MTTALRRLAILESQPLRTSQELLEWNCLRQWVLQDPRLLEMYRQQEFFAKMEEVTKIQIAPKNPRSIFSRFLNFIFRR